MTKNNKELSKKQEGMKENRGNLDLGKMKNGWLYLQGLLALCSLVVAIMAIFNNQFLKYLSITLGLTLLSMAYNNHRNYKRRGFTAIYAVIGLGVLISGILEFL